MKTLHPFLIALLLAAGQAWAQDIKLYEKAPSVEELERQLTGGDASTGKKKIRTRAIVFGDAPPAAAQQQEQAAPMPAAAATQQTYQQQPQAAYQPAQQQAMQVGERAIAFPINFRVNSAEVMPESVPFIESVAGLLQKDPGLRLLVEGHTDATGSAARNVTLSRERAFSIMNYLIDHYRVDPMRLVPVGRGSGEPLGGTDPTNPKNRRVQFRIIG
ncbi:MAG: OmpA family protein [Rhodocyclaceae bacterium]|nr:OmpA family protein [Rhodocyclaceae bacterium]